MSTRCAVCDGPIFKGIRFKLVETEVVHDTCIANLQDTLVRRLKRGLADLKADRDSATAARVHADVRASASARLLAAKETRLAAKESQLQQSEARATVLAGQVMELQRQVAEVTLERERLRNELATRALIQPPDVTPQEQDAEQPDDGSAKRFSLLEID